ncbi:MAG: sigma-70 family RNA polymerase sigma factor [Kofleriaceae bacterium]|nr:sigma-70 family RNA polymerase sigma factor [Myxococcales bacterium]MCB9573772.1 sigma-70 family RNA polymerase sigma factor [Kofleriaceae bacterium]
MDERPEVEIRAPWAAGAFDDALTATLQLYGEEVYSFLISRLPGDDVAADVFAQTCEDLWRSLPTFEWRCSMRTWCYRLARSAAARYHRAPANQVARRVELSQISELAHQVRSRTMAHLRTEVKDGVHRLRERLSADEQTLLTLRIDRDLSWQEIAQIMFDDVDDDDALKRAAARLRQSFQKLKARLRELAEAEGLLEGG